jgi:hypothetical protein
MFVSFCRVVLYKIDLSALNLVSYPPFIVDVVENPNYETQMVIARAVRKVDQ